MIRIMNGIDNKIIDLNLRREIAMYTETIQFYIKVSSIKTIDENVNICFLDLNNYFKYKDALKNLLTKIVLILYDDEEIFIDSINVYYINANKISSQLKPLMNKIIYEIKKQTIIVPIPNKGDKRICLQQLNYIDINRRNLGYHMTNNIIIKGKTVRSSFEKEVKPYFNHDELYFMKPGFLINLSNINELYPNYILFESGEKLYFPKTAYKAIKEKWIKFYIEEE